MLALLLISLSLLLLLTPAGLELIPFLLWRGLAGGFLGCLAALVPLFIFIHSHLILLVVPYFIVSVIWGMVAAVLIGIISGIRNLEIEFNTDNRAITGALLGLLFGGAMAGYYPPLWSITGTGLVVIWLTLGVFSGIGAGIKSVPMGGKYAD
jgi:prepilin signal peptidase PulO-like enzyme (type II secretory pathway)